MKYCTYVLSPCGTIQIEGDENTILAIRFQEGRPYEELPMPLAIQQIVQELSLYFAGKLSSFSAPLQIQGTPFQKSVWEELQKIPYGETRSYQEIAISLGKPTGYRAVAMANRANPFAIIIPCHRVIYKGGSLGGYAGGLEKKQWLLEQERIQAINLPK